MKKKNTLPRRWKLKRPARLQVAKKWLSEYKSNNPIKGYMKWFHVDRVTSLIELKILGENVTEEEIEDAKIQMRSKPKEKEVDDSPLDSDENFSFIAGYTSNCFPFGITHEEEND